MTREAIDTMLPGSVAITPASSSASPPTDSVAGSLVPKSEVFDRIAMISDLPKFAGSTVIE